MKTLYRIGHTLSRTVALLGFSLRAYGRENLIEEGPAIIASNHQSYLDPPFIGSCCRRELYFLTRKNLLEKPLIGPVLRQLNTVPVDRERGDVSAFKAILRILQSGNRLIIFPEGTRTTDGNLQPARAGIGMVIAKTRAPVIPARIFGTFEALPRTGGLKLRPVTVVFGPPLRFDKEEFAANDRELYQRLGDRVMSEIRKLQLPPERR
ncbi:MAG: 1-acyl-sn-glycerol-3-phosphate acyltransferase [Verrucomicrobia bacterium]|nr:1-acyl-sn-glycerol-3-phosphate acyltransferase [Verrucomicrobiota bacterium]